MARAGALLLALVTAWGLARVAPAAAEFNVSALAVGLALIAATIAGSLIERLGLPRVTGYLLFGLICGPYVANIITRPMARELAVLNGLAVTLIAFVAGLEVNLRRLLPQLRDVAVLGGVTMAVLYAGLFAAIWIAWPWLPIAPDLSGLQRFAAAATLATLVASFSPTVTIALVAESRASGPLTQLTLAVVILSDLVLILGFTLVMELARRAFGGTAEVGLAVGLGWEIFGSLASGAIAGALMAFYLKYVGRELPIIVLALCAAITGIGHVFHLEPLLTALAAGLVLENVTPNAGDRMKQAVEHSALPVLVIFFAAAGASLQIDALATIGTVAAALALLRALLIRGGVAAGRRVGGLRDQASELVWMGLVSQAGVTVGLALIVAAEYPQWGAAIQTVMLSLVALHQLIGPVLFKRALVVADEVGALNTGTGAK